MKTRISSRSSNIWRKSGTTLIEVVAAIAIMGTLLAGALLARSRHVHQEALAVRTLVAVRLLDDWLVQHWGQLDSIPENWSGHLPGADDMTLSTQFVANDAMQGLGARVLRVEVHELTTARTGGLSLTPDKSFPLVAVELVVSEGEPGRSSAPLHGSVFSSPRRTFSHPVDARQDARP